MVREITLAQSTVLAELAASLPQYDPLDRRERRLGGWLVLISIALHMALLLAFWDTLITVLVEEEEIVTVRMLEQEKPEPEPPKLKRKTLARRVLNTSVHRFKKVVQRKVEVVKPVAVLDRARKVEIDRVKTTEAPKQITLKQITVKKVSEFAEFKSEVQPVAVDVSMPSVHQVQSARASAGPRKLEAAGPVTHARTVDLEAPALTQGVISSRAVEGDVDGTRVEALESGYQSGALNSNDGLGLIPGANRDCMEDPICRRYIEMVRDRVYARWHPGSEVRAGQVSLRFRIDRGGSAHGIRVAKADDDLLGETCLQAFQHASPFPPPPKEIHYLVTKGLIATFRHSIE